MSGMAGMTLLHSGWGIHFLDYDNDGLKDLLVAQGHDSDVVELNSPQIHYKEPMLLARNTGHGFVDVSAISGDVFKQVWVGRGMAVGDLDNDGRVDAVVAVNGGRGAYSAQRDGDGEPLADAESGGASQQSRCDRRGGEADDLEGNAVGDGFDGGRVSLVERQAGALRAGQRDAWRRRSRFTGRAASCRSSKM